MPIARQFEIISLQVSQRLRSRRFHCFRIFQFYALHAAMRGHDSLLRAWGDIIRILYTKNTIKKGWTLHILWYDHFDYEYPQGGRTMSENSIWVTTKGGDKGLTSLGNGQRVPKDHPRVELYGTLDECQASLGMARATSCHEEIREQLLAIENELGAVMGYLALFPNIPEPDPASLEKVVERVREAVNAQFRFVRPGDSIPGAALHMARTVARRAERVAVRLYREGDLTDNAYAYVNRLSDAVYAISLWSDRLDRQCGTSTQTP